MKDVAKKYISSFIQAFGIILLVVGFYNFFLVTIIGLIIFMIGNHYYHRYNVKKEGKTNIFYSGIVLILMAIFLSGLSTYLLGLTSVIFVSLPFLFIGLGLIFYSRAKTH